MRVAVRQGAQTMRTPRFMGTIDLVGGVLVGACVALGAWFAFGPPRQAAAEVEETRYQAEMLEGELHTLWTSLQTARARLDQMRARVSELGALPSQSPIEKDLDTIAELARSHDLIISEVAPHSTVEYPGLRELQYTIKGAGSFVDWLAFFQEFEQRDFWADITHVKIEAATAPARASSPVASMTLTISFYSAATEGGGKSEAIQ